jgi:hypothetical protein
MRIPRGHPQERPEASLLGGGSVPPGHEKDGQTMMAMVPPTARKHDGTYEIPNR